MSTIGKNLKTIAAHVSVDLLDDVLHFHNKGNLNVDNKFKNRVIHYNNLNLEQLQELQFSDFEISPFHDDIVAGYNIQNDAGSSDAGTNSSLRRHRSATYFETEKVNFLTLKKLLKNSFATQADGSRPYPSGGGIYPVEVICLIFADKLYHAPASGFYHYRPTGNCLQPIRYCAADEMRKVIYHLDSIETSEPGFAFLYLGVAGKMLVKYRHRGYRYALMEAGSMYHQADLVGQTLQLRNRLYSGFNDQELTKLIGLDNMNFLPMVIQSFGAASCK